MKNANAALDRLVPVLDMAFQVEQAKMSKINLWIVDLKRQMACLDQPSTFDPMQTASLAGADLLWDRWVQDRRTLINHEIALAYRDREQARTRIIAALSKVEAAKKMRNTLMSQARQLAARRAI